MLLRIAARLVTLAATLTDVPANDTTASDWLAPEASPLGKRTTLALARSGALESAKIGRKVLIQRSSLESYVARHRRGIEAEDADEDLFGAAAGGAR